ncbi:MAG TPA: YbaK/EbsC family protein [Kineosporiaceae bacterium]|jgi:prolyl-tRNA editing enzyme YbaK/EbsC (Cys-tRNA(Pro) deacylase)|nr:YbaK/EbsC family protein [Kineosporiaceae bacterium]
MSQSSTSSGVAEHPSVVRVRAALAAAGADAGAVVVLDDHARTAAAAAEQLGVTVAQIANSLVFAVPDEAAPEGRRPLLVLTSGAHRVDTAKVAALLGVERLDRADPDFVRGTTGFAIGGVAPVGHAGPIETLVDVDLARHEQVWAAAGHARTVFPTTFDELLRITGGRAAEVA